LATGGAAYAYRLADRGYLFHRTLGWMLWGFLFCWLRGIM
jgi:hypothetical protein